MDRKSWGQMWLVGFVSLCWAVTAQATPSSWPDGIEFAHPESNTRVNLRFRIQNRADFRFRDADASPTHDWQVRRMRLRLNGQLLDPRLTFGVQFGFSRRDMDFDETRFPGVLRDAMIFYQLTDAWQFGFGQGKLPGNRQRVISSGEQQFVDRSIVNAAFNIDRDFGFQSRYKTAIGDQLFAWKNAITSGEGRNQVMPANRSLFYTTRVEWLPLGEFAKNGDNSESDLAFEPEWKVSMGYTLSSMPDAPRENGTVGKVFTTTGVQGDPVVGRSQTVQYLDVLAKRQGLSIYGEWARRQARTAEVNATQSVLVGQGFNLQVAKLLTDSFELGLRHSQVLPESSVRRVHSIRRDWTLVVNQFINRHRVKLQGEVGRLDGVETYVRLQMELGI